MCVSLFAGAPIAEAAEPDALPLTDVSTVRLDCQDGVTLHCFCWTYKDIMEELPNIKDAGFSSVLVAPVQWGVTSIMGSWVFAIWSSMYLPFEFSVNDSQLGGGYNKEDLTALCKEADKYGINIIMDVVANHLMVRQIDRHTDKLNDSKYFHNNGNITDYDDRQQVINNNSGGLDDLKTEDKEVQQIVADYIKELKNIGVDGIRWDSAKHIGLPSEGDDFWKAVIDKELYNYGEILTAPVDGEQNTELANSLMKEYTEYMSVTDNKYGNDLLQGFKKGEAADVHCRWLDCGISSDKLLFWGESHDTYSNDPSMFGEESTTKVDQNLVDRAYAVGAAREGATALYLSRPLLGYYDEDEDSMNAPDIFNYEKGSMHFLSPEVRAVNLFHNAMLGRKDCAIVSNNCEVVTRENGGAVIVCGSGNVTVENAGGYVPEGTYTDSVSGNEFTVTKDTITGTVGESGIAVIYDSDDCLRMYSCVVDVYGEDGYNESYDNNLYEWEKIILKAPNITETRYIFEYTDKDSKKQTIEGDFKDGDIIDLEEINIRSKAQENTLITITLTGVDEKGRSVSRSFGYSFRKSLDPEKSYGMGILFDNNLVNWDEVYVYAYMKIGDEIKENAPYPGKKAIYAGSGTYMSPVTDDLEEILQDDLEYDIEEDYYNSPIYLVFSDGKGNNISTYNGEDISLTIKSFYTSSIEKHWMFKGAVPEEHVHTLKTIPAREATEKEDGNIEYFVCEECGKLFSDKDGLVEIEKSQVIIPAKKDDNMDTDKTKPLPTPTDNNGVINTGDSTTDIILVLTSMLCLSLSVMYFSGKSKSRKKKEN